MPIKYGMMVILFDHIVSFLKKCLIQCFLIDIFYHCRTKSFMNIMDTSYYVIARFFIFLSKVIGQYLT